MAKLFSETKLRAIDDEVGIVLPQEVLTNMNLKAGDTVHLIRTDGGYKLTLLDEKVRKGLEAAEDVIKRYPNTLRELAKH